MAACLEHVSEFLPITYGHFAQSWDSNWKMGVEITMEGYHAPLVHPTSFSVHAGIDEKPDEGVDALSHASGNFGGPYGGADDLQGIEFVDPHSMDHVPLSENSTRYLRAVGERLKMPRSPQLTGYWHYFIYPNFLVGVNEGVNVCVQLYEPVAPDKTNARFWLLTGTPDPKLKDGIIWQTSTKGWKDWTEMNSTEDKIACEAVQKGVRYGQRPAVLGRVEERLQRFQSLLLKDVRDSRIAA
jgi:phenylpropionate dioxygenase-like ring-hydroxylating dioxygenase large terminal subunit